MKPGHTIKGDWDSLYSNRNIYVRRAEKYAAWTIPAVFPRENTTLTEEFQTDYQSNGAEYTETLVAKTMQAVFPVGRPFFRYDPTTLSLIQFQEAGVDTSKVNDVVAAAERKSSKLFESKGCRTVLTEAVRAAIITGEALYKTGEVYEYWTMHDYVVEKNCAGQPTRFIIKEKVQVNDLPDDARDAYLAKYPNAGQGQDSDKEVCFYTDVRRERTPGGDKSVWKVYLSVEEVELPSDYGQYSDEDNPYNLLEWQAPKGRPVAVGQVELYSGDMHALSRLNKAVIPRLALACRLVMLANPAGMTKPAVVNGANDGDTVPGRSEDMSRADFGSLADFMQLNQYIDPIAQRLARAFLATTGTVRQAERVTAEEIKLLANELNQRLGGAYTRLVNSLQKPVARDLTKDLKLPVDDKFVEITIITGLDALSRNADQENLLTSLNQLAILNNIPPDVRMQLNVNAIVSATFRNNGVITTEYTLTPEQVQQNTQQQAAAQQATGQ